MSLLATLQRTNQTRKHFASTPNFLISCYNKLIRRVPSLPMPRRNAPVGIRMRDMTAPISVRLGSSDLEVARELFIEGEYAPIMSLTGIRQVVDLGANCGLSIRLWQDTWPGVAIVAVEPDDANLECCRRNSQSAAPNVRPILVKACATGTPRKVFLERPPGQQWAFRIGGDHAANASAKATECIDGLTIPEIIDRAGFTGDIDLVKCDIEGAEREVFQDCSAWIGRTRYLVVETHAPYTIETLSADLARAGGSFELIHSVQTNDLGLAFYRRR